MKYNNIYFYDCISKVTITDQFDEKYMEVFKKYPVEAKLFQIVDGKKIRVTKEKVERSCNIRTYVIDLSTRRIVIDLPVNKMPDIIFDTIKLKRREKLISYFIINSHKNYFNN